MYDETDPISQIWINLKVATVIHILFQGHGQGSRKCKQPEIFWKKKTMTERLHTDSRYGKFQE